MTTYQRVEREPEPKAPEEPDGDDRILGPPLEDEERKIRKGASDDSPPSD